MNLKGLKYGVVADLRRRIHSYFGNIQLPNWLPFVNKM
jgi:hypothetical protein